MEYFERLSTLYGLACIEQDMGICSADPKRLDEFIEIFFRHIADDPWEWEELADLVFASANEVMLSSELTDEQKNKIVLLVFDHKSKITNSLEYWLGLDEERYPIIGLIKSGSY